MLYSRFDPFGMIIPGRNESAGSDYRYGFQGQEMDDEIKGEGNSVNYKYRMHDPRVGRFFAVDPLAAKYPHNSVYAFSENMVIHKIELEGLESEDPWYLREPDLSTIHSVEDANRLLDKYMGAYTELHNSGQYETAAFLKNKIETYIEASPFQPTTTFEVEGAGVNAGVGIVQGAYGGVGIKTERGTGVWENGVTVETSSFDAGFAASVGITANVILGGEIESTEPTTSVLNRVDRIGNTANVSGGGAFAIGYQYDSYSFQTVAGGTPLFEGSSHSMAFGLGAGVGFTGTVVTIDTKLEYTLDSSQSAADNLLIHTNNEFYNWGLNRYGDSTIQKFLQLRDNDTYEDALNGNHIDSNSGSNSGGNSDSSNSGSNSSN